ncbi:MAG: hypothetical protein M5U14_04105 [Acidimicrobiia bacterium]|nr:hypothetical protein [Acidimicrobiia bacterium]
MVARPLEEGPSPVSATSDGPYGRDDHRWRQEWIRMASTTDVPSDRRTASTIGTQLRDLVVGGAQIVGVLLAAPVLRRWYNRWGATPEELTRHLPGDELVLDPKLGYTRVVTIDAPPSDVWPWLVQLGQGRGGFYSFDVLENLIGCRIHSTDRILPEHQHLERGDLVRSGPERYPCWEVLEVEPPHHLVLMGADPDTLRAPPVVAMIPRRATWPRPGSGYSSRSQPGPPPASSSANVSPTAATRPSSGTSSSPSTS